MRRARAACVQQKQKVWLIATVVYNDVGKRSVWAHLKGLQCQRAAAEWRAYSTWAGLEAAVAAGAQAVPVGLAQAVDQKGMMG